MFDRSDLPGFVGSAISTLLGRIVAFLALGSLAHLLGVFFFLAGENAVSVYRGAGWGSFDLDLDDIYLLPLKWVFTVASIGIHPVGALGAIAFVWALLCFLWDEEYVAQGALMFAIVQPIDSFAAQLLWTQSALFPPSFAQTIGSVLLAGYESLFVIWWWRRRQKGREEAEEEE